GEVTFVDEDASRGESVAEWVQEQLESIVRHRLAPPATTDRAKPVLRFAETGDEHPPGPLLIFHRGPLASSYGIKDRQITVVNRTVGKENFTIFVLENDRNPEGRYLPRSYVVRYWDAATGRLLRSETVQDGWQRVGSLDLPTRHAMTTATDAGL